MLTKHLASSLHQVISGVKKQTWSNCYGSWPLNAPRGPGLGREGQPAHLKKLEALQVKERTPRCGSGQEEAHTNGHKGMQWRLLGLQPALQESTGKHLGRVPQTIMPWPRKWPAVTCHRRGGHANTHKASLPQNPLTITFPAKTSGKHTALSIVKFWIWPLLFFF